MLEDLGVQVRYVDKREGHDETSNDGPEEELVVVDGAEDGEGAVPARVHGKQTAVEVLHLPGGDQEKEADSGKCGSAGPEDELATGAGVLVAASREIMETFAGATKGDKHEDHETDGAHACTVDELIADKILGEDTSAEGARGTFEDIRLRLLETETKGQGRRGYQVGPQNLEGREREDGVLRGVLERETYQEQDDLGQVGSQKMEEELKD